MAISICLTEQERQMALNEAHRRQSSNENRGLYGRNGGPRYGEKALKAHEVGAMGEVAVATLLGMKEFLFQETEARRGSVDLPPDIDVKTRNGHNRDLIIQLSESRNKRFVLVTIEDNAILIHGWINGKEAMQDQYILDPARGRKAYFVPQKALQPMETFQCLNVPTLLNTL